MRSESERWMGALLHGWVEVLTLFAMLLVALVLIGWAWNRGLRASDRKGIVPVQLLITGLGLVLLLRHFKDDLWPAIIVAVGVSLAGVLSRGNDHGALWVPVTLLAALLGLGLNLSFVVLTALTMLVLLFSAGRGR